MKRLHVHVSVPELDRGIGFYRKLFGSEPAVIKADYAKWMLDDPRVNFAISTRHATYGINHLGLQVDSAEELAALRGQAEAADLAVVDEPGASCCYARANKHWLQDPAGVPWETFHTLEQIPVFGAAPEKASAETCARDAGVCCPVSEQSESKAAACCG